jgi:hypothetical protein
MNKPCGIIEVIEPSSGHSSQAATLCLKWCEIWCFLSFFASGDDFERDMDRFPIEIIHECLVFAKDGPVPIIEGYRSLPGLLSLPVHSMWPETEDGENPPIGCEF